MIMDDVFNHSGLYNWESFLARWAAASVSTISGLIREVTVVSQLVCTWSWMTHLSCRSLWVQTLPYHYSQTWSSTGGAGSKSALNKNLCKFHWVGTSLHALHPVTANSVETGSLPEGNLLLQLQILDLSQTLSPPVKPLVCYCSLVQVEAQAV